MTTASHIFLVRPANFGFNSQTAETNTFQNKPAPASDLKKKVLAEFDAFAKKLIAAGVRVMVFEDTVTPAKPDAIFPNNWISTHEDGKIVLYPMCTPNRRPERNPAIVAKLKTSFAIKTLDDLSVFEKENKFLEGTGSVVFDRANKIAYACLSLRTHKELFLETSRALNYKPLHFWAFDQNGNAIYHTNVMMCVCEKFAVVCTESISNEKERKALVSSLENSGHEVIKISFEQMNRFAGNMLELKTNKGENILALSQSAFDALTTAQKQQIEKHCRLLPLAIPTIETIGGGSARCMIAEIFVPCL